jgi:ammonia channel protein AmtB
MTQFQPPPMPAERRSNGLGIAATILGAIAILFSIIPMCGLIPAIVLSVVGGILGAVGFFAAVSDKRTSIAFPLVGVALCVMAVIIGLVMTTIGATSLKNATEAKRAEWEKLATQPATLPANP